MSTYTLTRLSPGFGGLGHSIIDDSGKSHLIGVYASLLKDGSEEEYIPGSRREYNHHKTGDAYYNRHVAGSYDSPVQGPLGKPIDFNGHYLYSRFVESGTSYQHPIYSGLVQNVGTRISVGVQGSMSWSPQRGWLCGGNVSLYKVGDSEALLPEELWIQRGDWFIAGSGRFVYESGRIRAHEVGSVEEALSYLGYVASLFQTQPWDDVFNTYCDYHWSPSQGGYDLYVYKGDASKGSAAFDETFASFSRIQSYESLQTRDKQGLCQAYLKAIEGIPSLSGMNNLENALQCIALAKDIIVSKGKPAKLAKLPKEIRNIWLATRYSLGTSVSDVYEVGSYINRAADLIGSAVLKSDGYFYSDGKKYHVTLSWLPQDLKVLQTPLERLGFAPTASNLWDLVPYSFVVDWFLQIGSMLEFEETRQLALRAQPAESWMSIEKVGENAWGTHQSEYIRLPGFPSASDLSWLPDYQWYHPSGKTIAKRAVDAAALFLPKSR